MSGHIDAKFYPHIIDTIVDAFIAEHPRKARLVCKSWCKRVDKSNADWIAVDTCVPGLKSFPALRGDLAPEPYAWELCAARQPTVIYQRQSLWYGPGENYPPETQIVRDIELRPSMLDILDSVEWVHCPIELPPADTVRFQTERYRSLAVGCSLLMPHARRIIFSDGPYEDDFARATSTLPPPDALNRLTCRGNCGMQHTQRIVANARTPKAQGNDSSIELPQGLPELVVVFHGWRVVRGFDYHRPETYHAGDPLNDVRALVMTALKQGTPVTIVNPELHDLRTGEYRSNVIDVRAQLEDFVEIDLVEVGVANAVERIESMIEWLTLEEYRNRVGDEEFRIETMTDPEIRRLVDRRG